MCRQLQKLKLKEVGDPGELMSLRFMKHTLRLNPDF